MGKNKRKKKQKEEDFKKIKLKVGKKLPKGANETQTSFKSQGIVVPSQDLTKEGQLTNSRKQGLKDLLSHLSHYSPTVRQEALLGLRNLFQQHIHIFHDNLSSILGPIAAKMTDTDSDVRHSLLLLFRFILPHISSDQVAPFFPLLVAHLSCAMSHIYEDIQLESLEFFSLFLELFPKQISANSSQLLDHFIGLISQHSGGTLNQKSSKGSTKIAINPKGKLSSPKARLKILTQMYEFLKALYAEEIRAKTELDFLTESRAGSSLRFSQTKLTYKSVLFSDNKEPKICLFSLGDKTVGLEKFGQNLNEDTKKQGENSGIKEFMQKIVPLLLQFWVECNPSQLSTSLPGNALPDVDMSIMLTIMNILRILLHKLFNMEENNNFESLRNWIVSEYFKDFSMHFLKLFPFQDTTLHSKAKGKVKVVETNSNNLAMTLNISICEVMSFFVGASLVMSKQPVKNWTERMEDFVVESLDCGTSGEKVSIDQLKSLLIYVEKTLQEASNQEKSVSGQRILNSLYKLYKSSHFLSGVKNMLLKFFATLLLRRQKPTISTQLHLSWEAPLKQWIFTLPRLLIQLRTSSPEMTHTVLKVLCWLMKQKTVGVDQVELQKQLNSFIDSTSGPFCKLTKEIQNTTIELLFSLPAINNCLLQTLALCCHQHTISVDIVQYLLQVLFYRSPASFELLDKESAFGLSEYLSFLFSVAIGYTKKELDSLQTTNGEAVLTSFKIVQDSDVGKSWNKHQDILQVVCSIYAQLRNADQLVYIMEPVLDKTLNETKVLPLTVAGSLLQLYKCFSQLANIPAASSTADYPCTNACISPSLVSSLAELSFSCLLYSTNTDDTTNDCNLDIQNCLFENVMQLSTVQPSILEKILCILLSKPQDHSPEVTLITAKILQAFGRPYNPVFYSDAMGKLVNDIVEQLRSHEKQSSHFADLDYQFSLFHVEVNRRKGK